MHTILVVEDESAIADAIAERLRNEGYRVNVAEDGPSGVDCFRSCDPDLVVLDLMLPGFDGLEVCRRIQSERRVPVLMLTARDDETDLIVGLSVGADDYLTKPFSPRELVARVQAILRRSTEAPNPVAVESIGPVELDESTRTVKLAGDTVHLTPTEFDLVLCLVRARGAVLSREQLLHEVWGYRDGSGARTVDSHVRAVRRKLGDDVIRTVHSVGYAAGSASDA